jgi:asparagine synthase (glutamine-hydrolysing)
VCGTGDFDLYPQAVWHSEDPSASGNEIPGLILSKAASRSVKVVLTGQGSDEIFGGYPWFRWDKLLRPLAALPLPLRRLMLLGPLIPAWRPRASRIFLAPRTMNLTRYQRLMGAINPEIRELLFAPGLKERLAQAEHQDSNPAFEEPIRPWSRFAQLQYHELAIRLPNFITRTLDRASMAHGVEARVPFLDHELVELCAEIPPALKMRGLHEKHILRRAMRDVLPPEILRRKKRGLRAPSSQWLRDPLPPFAEDLLSADRLREKGYFVPDVVLGMLARHRQRTTSREGSLLMGVLAIQLWDNLFVRAQGPFGAG